MECSAIKIYFFYLYNLEKCDKGGKKNLFTNFLSYLGNRKKNKTNKPKSLQQSSEKKINK